ncbi:MAG: 3-dehydroquinate synthase family protein [Candidatus Shikimatogenerans sp. Tduv]|uniref:3-dehydroquinate synthase family protein n=1 Tax=Candidatus Shikimatogenerans sp. Tduv TaxID=3158567 RepID=A0AAU7QRT2_9FLAO
MIIINNYKLFNFFLKYYYKYNIILLIDVYIYKYYIKYILNNIYNKYIYKYIYILKIKNSEKYKNIYTCIKIINKLNKKKINKKSLLINIGGGVISDLGGFIASIYKRGIYNFNIPTTLLSMIDASIGGKNGINLSFLKNEIGTFYKPKIIFINNIFLSTLNKKNIISGIAEIIKYGLIFNYKLLLLIINNYKFNFNNNKWKKIIKLSIKIKLKIIKKDYKDNNVRKILNYGHTIGHAIETFFLIKNINLLHGESIALGFIYESYISYKKKFLSKTKYIYIKNIILKIYKYLYKYIYIIKKNYYIIINYMYNDKKNFNKKINFNILKNINQCIYNIVLNKKIIKKTLYINI